MNIYKRGRRELVKGHFADMYETDTGCMILIAKEGSPKRRWHMSMSHPSRLPDWYEFKQARYDLLPRDRHFAMVLPGDGAIYVNIHENCFHAWEVLGDELDEAIDR